MSLYLASPAEVVWGLLTYTDWWQPPTASVLQVGGARRSSGFTDGFSVGLLDHLDERAELRKRMQILRESDRHLLYLWYVAQLSVVDIASALGISRRQCFRRRASAIRRIVELGDEPAD
jgi:DNA-directed RNA polymerase specialized sigma24 family protein